MCLQLKIDFSLVNTSHIKLFIIILLYVYDGISLFSHDLIALVHVKSRSASKIIYSVVIIIYPHSVLLKQKKLCGIISNRSIPF